MILIGKYQSFSFYLLIFEVSKRQTQFCTEKCQQVILCVTNTDDYDLKEPHPMLEESYVTDFRSIFR